MTNQKVPNRTGKNREFATLVETTDLFFDHAHMLVVSSDLQLLKYTPAAARHITISYNDIGRAIADIATNIKSEIIVDDIKEVIKKGKVITRETEALNGKWYQMKTIPYVRHTDKTTKGAIISFNEITELKLIQLQLEKTNKDLLTINADLDGFICTASHDLLGPLANIELTISVMNELKVANDPQLLKFLAIINGSVKLFRSMLTELATIRKIEGDMSVMENIDLELLINNLTLSIGNTIRSAAAVIKKEFDVPQIFFSKKNLRSILYNLVTNGIKFRNPDRDPVIIISTKTEKEFTVLSVRDNGVGIPEREFENIFKMNGRLQKKREEDSIGLYLIKKIVDAAGGRIIVESDIGKGSIFTIYLKTQTVTPN
jgi:two-component system CheB/CheR fusion protein